MGSGIFLNEILYDGPTRLDSSLLPPDYRCHDQERRFIQETMAQIVDALGEESAHSQGLNRVITSAEKLRSNPMHILYVYNDQRGRNYLGEVIGILKVGRKHLFLFDEHEQVHEVEPLCVLDFYIIGNRQRMGIGKQLFDFMLQDLSINPWEMAIDGPSPKMESFLRRNYGIEKLLRQNNNFAVAPGFFDRPDHEISLSAASREVPPAAPAVGRFAARKPTSAIATVIHGGEQAGPSQRSPPPEGVEPTPPGDAEPTPAEQRDNSLLRVFQPSSWSDDDYPSEPELHDDVYEFDPDQPDMERRDEMRGLGVYRYSYCPPSPVLERPIALSVQQHDGDAPPGGADQLAADQPAAGMPSGAHSSTGTPSGAHSSTGTPSGRRDPQLTSQGFFDVKNYHNKLW